MNRDARLDYFEPYIWPPDDCILDFYVHERDSRWDDWEVVWSARAFTWLTVGSHYIYSSLVEVWLEEGKDYAIGVAWNYTATYYAEYGVSGHETGTWEYVGTVWDNSYSGFEGTAYRFPHETASGAAYYQRITMSW